MTRTVTATKSFAMAYTQMMVVVTIVCALGVWLPIWLLAGDFATGLGSAAMCAVWGAPGFGLMTAGIFFNDRLDDERAHRSATDPQPAPAARTNPAAHAAA